LTGPGACIHKEENTLRLQLVSFMLCPFVQRAVIVLREKQIEFNLEYIDLDEPPGWFKQISPLGKVPILRVGDEVLFESSVILDYLDDVYAPKLHPRDPLQRARHKSWIEYGSGLLMDQVAICLAPEEASYFAKLNSFRDNLERLTGPLAAGLLRGERDFSLLDAAYAPLFMRMEILAGLREELSGLYPAGVKAWSQRCLQQPSVAGSVVEDFTARYIDHFAAKHSWLMSTLRA
jgi:glutathione S-transferase